MHEAYTVHVIQSSRVDAVNSFSVESQAVVVDVASDVQTHFYSDRVIVA